MCGDRRCNFQISCNSFSFVTLCDAWTAMSGTSGGCSPLFGSGLLGRGIEPQAFFEIETKKKIPCLEWIHDFGQASVFRRCGPVKAPVEGIAGLSSTEVPGCTGLT